MNTPLVSVSRRDMLIGSGALVVNFSISRASLAQEATQGPRLPGSLRTTPMLDAWLRIDATGISVFTGKAELGQGVKTALLQIAAEELGLQLREITLVTADTNRTPNEGYTSGSQSMQDSGTAIRHAAAQARTLLIETAATRLGISPEELKVENGAIISPDGRSLRYAELASEGLLHVNAQPQSKLKEPGNYSIVGRDLPRVDIPAKVTGAPAYVQDLRVPGMMHARVVRPPSYGARLRAVDIAAVERMPGVVRIVRDGSFLAVVAAREYQAVRAMDVLARAAQWDGTTSLPDPGKLYEWIREARSDDFVLRDQQTAPSAGGRTFAVTYNRPYQIHGSIGPSCAVALSDAGRLTIWTHSQGVYPLRAAIAEMLSMPVQQVHCIHMEGSGCYGHNGADDVAADAALIARELPGRPVRVQWMRDQEQAWEPFGAAMVTLARASLGDDGRIADWQYEVWSNTHSTRPAPAGNLMPAWHLATPFAQPAPEPIPQPAGGGDRNAIPLYRFANTRVIHHFIPEMPVRVSALRGLGAYMNVFSIESFMDELATAAGIDPVEFRLRHLEDSRARDVINTAAEKFGWKADAKLPKGRGRGFGFARYKNLAAYTAVAIELEVERDSGAVQLVRCVAADDSGQIVNPNGLRNQIEGGIVQAASWTLHEEVTFDRTAITSRDWSSYPILRFPELPESVEVHLINRPGQPFLGSGECAQGPAAAAIANAVAHATGTRFRQLPLTRERIRAATRAGAA